MPRGFNDQEREYYRKRLMEAGSRFFAERGLSSVSVDMLVKEAGIAKGSFYKFFNNKEELCFFCLMDLEKRVRENILQKVEGLNPGEKIRELILLLPGIIDEYPLLKMFNQKGELEKLFMKVRPEHLNNNFQGDMDFFRELFPPSPKSEIPAETMTGFFWSLLFLAFNKDLVGEPFSGVIELIADMASGYLKEKL